VSQAFGDGKFRADLLQLLLDTYSPIATPKKTTPALTAAASLVLNHLALSGGGFDPDFDDPEEFPFESAARAFVTDEFAPAFAAAFGLVKDMCRAVGEEELAVYRAPAGELWSKGGGEGGGGGAKVAAAKKAGGKQKGGKFGGDAEDEEWERQMKEELAAKKKKAAAASEAPSARAYSKEELKTIGEQGEAREATHAVLMALHGCLGLVKSLCRTDCIVVNTALGSLGPVVIEFLLDPPELIGLFPMNLKVLSNSTLISLASCVYEISTLDAAPLCNALLLTKNGKVPTPNPCPSAAQAIAGIAEACEDDKLSGPSFQFVFPLVAACLTGERSVPGCEAVMQIVDVHAKQMGDEDCPAATRGLRRDIAFAVLGLLKHDRHQTFKPSPAEVLATLYDTPEVKVRGGGVRSAHNRSDVNLRLFVSGECEAPITALTSTFVCSCPPPSLYPSNPPTR
jgi:hypothetical protein